MPPMLSRFIVPEDAASTRSGTACESAEISTSTIRWVVMIFALQTATGYLADKTVPSLTIISIGL